MKRIVIFLCAFTIMIPCVGHAFGFDDPASLIANYCYWAYLFGIENIDTDIQTIKTSDSEVTMSADSLHVVYDWSTIKTKRAYMNFVSSGDNAEQQMVRAMALFSAIEYESPFAFSPENLQEETDEAYFSSLEMFSKLMKIYNTNQNKLFRSNSPLKFYSSDYADYSLIYKNKVLMILVDH